MYKISKYTKDKAKKLGVVVKPSTNKKKKIDVFKDKKKIASVGAINYKDYTIYLKEDKKKAEIRRKAYKKRHEKDRHKKGSNGYYADQLLW